MDLIALGTIALDNVKTASGARRNMLGGSAAHFAMGARLFTKVHLVGIVGHDFPDAHIRFLKKKGVDLTSVVTHHGKSFRWEGEYKKRRLQQCHHAGDGTGRFAGLHAARRRTSTQDPESIFGEHRSRRPDAAAGIDGPAAAYWLGQHEPVDQSQEALFAAVDEKVNLFVANDAEARSLTGENNLIKAAKQLRRLGPELIVVKKGEHGVLFYCDRFMFSFPAYPVEEVIDPTGAGDTFAGGLMGYLSRVKRLNEKELKQAVLHATTVASFNVEGFGMSKTSTLTLARVRGRMKQLLKFMKP